METLENYLVQGGFNATFSHYAVWTLIHIIVPYFAFLFIVFWLEAFWPKGQGDEKKTKKQLLIVKLLLGAALFIVSFVWSAGGSSNVVGVSNDFMSILEAHLAQIISAAILLTFGVIAFLRSWTGSFFIDKRDVVKGQKSAPPPAKPYWFGVVSAVGFFLCAIIGLWQPLCFLGLPLFWRLGSIMMPEVTERWVPKFMKMPFLIPRGPLRMKFGDWYFYGSKHGNHRNKDVNAPILPWYFVWLGIPVWLPLYSITLLRYEAIERKYATGFVPLKDNSTANIDLRVGVITCQHPSRFLQMSSEDQATSVEVAGTVIINDVISVMGAMTFEEVKGLDVTFDQPKQNELGGKLLRAVGHNFDTLDFGDPTRNPEIEKAQNAEAAAESESKRKIRLRQAEGEAFTAEVDAALPSLGLNPEDATYEQRLRCLREMGDLALKKASNVKVIGGSGSGVINVD